MATPSLGDLMSRWRALRREGRSVSVDGLGSDCSELLSDPDQRVEAVAFMEDFLDLARSSPCSDAVLEAAPLTFRNAHAPGHQTGGPDPLAVTVGAGNPVAAEVPIATLTPEGYEILGRLGQGGMGVVYKARQKDLNRLVALKMIHSRGRPDAKQRGRFRREAESVARLHHPNVVQIYETGEHDGRPFLAMEYVEGTNLERFLAGKPQPVRESARLVATLAEAVQHAHEADVVHRDLKPANILLQTKERTTGDTGNTGENNQNEYLFSGSFPVSPVSPVVPFVPKITDFGLAKLLDDDTGQTYDGQVMGTPSYMAPEQASGNSGVAGPWTDIWALGAILYELLTGWPPFKGETLWDTLEQVRTLDPVPPSRLRPKVPRDLEIICLKCLRKAPQARYASAAALAEDLRRFLDDRPILARPVGWGKRAVKWVRRRPALAALAFVLLASISGATGFAIWHNAELQWQLTRELDQTNRERIDALHDAAEEMLQAGKAAARVKDWEVATRQLSGAIGKTRNEPELEALGEEAQRCLDEIGAARRQHDAFVRLSGKAWPELPRVISRDDSVDRDETLRSAWRALDVVGIRPDNRGGPAVDARFFSNEEREEIGCDCYRLLLVLAVAEATPTRGRPPTEAQFLRALAILDRAEATGRGSRAIHLRRAGLLEQLGRPAGEQIKAAERIKAQDAVDLFLEGVTLFAEGRLEQAARRFTRSLDLRRNDFWAQYHRSLCNLRLAVEHPERAGQYWRAVEEGLTTCIAGRPDFLLSYVLRGYVRGELGDAAGSEADFTAVLARKPDPLTRYALLVNRGTVRSRRHETKAEAEQDLLQAIDLQPKLFQAHLNLARVYQENGKLKEARAEYDEAIALAGNTPAGVALYRRRGRLLIEMNENDTALRDLDKAVRLAAGRPSTGRNREVALDHLDRASLLRQAGKLDEAVQACKQATLAFPALVAAYRVHGEILFRQEKFADALLLLSLYLEASKQSPMAAPPPASVYRMRALALARTNKPVEALADYNRALDQKVDAATLSERGWLYVRNEAPKLAENDFARAIKEDPKFGDAYNGRGFLRVVRDGKSETGVADAEFALKYGPETWRLVYNAARVYAQASQPALLERDPHLSRAQIEDLCARYQGRAVELIRKALALQKGEQVEKFWKGVVLEDSALKPIHASAAFLRLVRNHPEPKKSRRGAEEQR
jgi:tetratricopeptide (TPR) repeat protein